MKNPTLLLCLRKIHFIIALFICLMTTSSYAQKIRTTFIGNCAFKFQLDTLTLFSDFPYQSGAYGYMSYSMDSVYKNEKGLALITHKHNDHFSGKFFSKTNLKRVGPKVSKKKITSLEKKYGLLIHPIRTKHNFSFNHRSHSVKWKNRSIYFMGDTESYEKLVTEKEFDILFITPWILDNLKRDSIKLKANTIFLYHHTSDVGPVQKKETDICECDFIIPSQNETYEI